MASSAEADGPLTGATALVTGASSGIGLETAARLRAAGAWVAMVARSEGPLGAAADALGGHAFAADVSDAAAVLHLTTRVCDALGGEPPSIIVNAAGAFRLAPIAGADPTDFDRLIAVNLRGPFLLMRALLPAMLARGSGHIVTIGSVAGRQAFPHNAAYSASKFGVRGLHAVLDAELRGTGVRATLVEPGATETPLWDTVDFSSHPGLPPREAMLPAGAVADAVVFALTRPAEVDVRTIGLDRA